MKKQLFYPKDGSDWEKRIVQFLEQDIDEEAVIFIDNRQSKVLDGSSQKRRRNIYHIWQMRGVMLSVHHE